ncbi:MAG: hypothetical protein JO269_04940 [Burkholderiaceae bacterium]|nr:hypothetical protein [Burkholderiaceae bacterium]
MRPAYPWQKIIICAAVLGITGCKPSGPPPDIVKTQREDLQKAKAVGAVEQKAADDQKKAADEATK